MSRLCWLGGGDFFEHGDRQSGDWQIFTRMLSDLNLGATLAQA